MANHLIIGLGGTGGQILCGLRKRIYSETGRKEINGKTNVDYLYVDSSEDDLNNRSNWVYMGEALHLAPAQKVSIHGMQSGVLDRLSAYPGIESFLNEKDKTLLQNDQVMSIISAGIGGQRRRFGRMLIANNISTNDMDASFVSRLRDKILSLIAQGEGALDFHVCAGLAGGTGSGSIVDVVAQIKKITEPMGNQFRLFLYLYIPEVLVPERHNAGFYHANGYAALKELNAMSLGVYTPSDVSGERDYQTGKVMYLLKNGDSFTKAYLFSNFNEENKVLPKDKKLPEAVADFLFQKTVVPGLIGVNGAMGRLESAENEGNAPEKDEAGVNVHSREFMSFGIKRIEYPETEIIEYGSYKFAEQASKQLTYNLWVDGKGYSTCSIDEVGQGYKQIFQDKQEKEFERLKLSNRYITLQAPIREIKGVTDNWQDFYSYWETITQFFGEDATDDSDKRGWIASFDKSCEMEFNSNYRATGVKKFFETQRSENNGYALWIKRHVETLLFNDWQAGTKSLLEIEKYVMTLQSHNVDRQFACEDKIATLNSYMEQETLPKIENVLNDWNNIGWLRDAITGASRKIFDQYKSLKCEYYTIKTEIESYAYARTLLAAVGQQLGLLLKGIVDFKESLNVVLKRVHESAEEKCKIETAVNSQEARVLDKKYNPAQIRELFSNLTIDSELQKSNAKEIRDILAGFVGDEERSFSLLSQSIGDIDTLSHSIIQTSQRNAKNAMNDLAEKDATLKMLKVNILEKIKQTYPTEEQLRTYIREIVQQSRCFMQFDSAEMGKVSPGQNAVGMRRIVQLCLPEYNDPSNFRDRFIQYFSEECPGFSPKDDVAQNHRESQMVIVTASASYPLRYVQNLRFLESKYKGLTHNQQGELNKTLLHTETFVKDLPELFEENVVDRRAKQLPYAIILHSLNITELKTDPETGSTRKAVAKGSGFSRTWLYVGNNMEESTNMLTDDTVLARNIQELVDGILGTDYKLNAEREALRTRIEETVCAEILPLCNNNDLNPLFIEYRNAAEKLFETKLINR